MRDIKRGVRTDDEFVSTMQKIIKFIVRHREVSIWVGVGFIAVIVLLIYSFTRGEQKSPEADLLHTQVMGLIATGRIQEAENVLLELTKKYQNTRPGKIGLYYLGVLYYNTGRLGEALDYFDKFLQLQKQDFLLVPSALYGAGCTAEGIKDYERALDYYERIIKDEDCEFYLQGMLAYGRVNGIIGNLDKAREVLKKLLEQNPPSEIAADAKFYLGYFNE